MTKKILHVDLDAFFCSVEELLHPELVNKAFAVGGDPGRRGVVSTCSYSARQYGVRSAMPMARALRACPQLIVVRGTFKEYAARSDQVMGILRKYSGLVEEVSVDEAFLDVTDIQRKSGDIALEIQTVIRNETGLPCSIGAASNKLVAKIATDYGKSKHKGSTPPRAITVVNAGNEREFLAPLPVRSLWGVGPKMEQALARMGISTIGDLATADASILTRHFGKWGEDLRRHALGTSSDVINLVHEVKSISNETTFDVDVTDKSILIKTLRRLSQQVGFRLRTQSLSAQTVRIKLRWSDFTTITRQVSLAEAADQDAVICKAAITLFENACQASAPVRLIGVGVSGLMERVHQLSLWDKPSDKERRLLGAIDEVRRKYGCDVLTKGFSEYKPPKR